MITGKNKLTISSYDDIKNPFYGGGGAIAIHELAKRLISKYQVNIISWNHSGIANEVIDGVNYTRIGSKVVHPKIGMLFFQLCLPFVMMTSKFDLWIESFSPPFTTAFLPLFTKRPVIGVVHMLAAEDMRRKYKISLEKLEKLGLGFYKYIVVTSTNLKSKIQLLNKTINIRVIENGVDIGINHKTKRKKQVLFLGRLELDQKGLDLLVKAFSVFTKNNPNFMLAIAGNGSEQEVSKLKKMIDSCNLSDRVYLAGRVSGLKKQQLLNESYCLVIPSRFETFSIVALEAMAAGLPLVTFDIDGLGWIPKQAVVKAKSFDINSLSRQMSKVVNDQKLMSRMKSEGLAYAQDFTWDIVAKKYEELIDEIHN
ncbi:MAG: glycosyltransferase family 4 protein [Parachlamydiales bacterium]|jgi:glycosyltransferase involved in cell wall biosynthesis